MTLPIPSAGPHPEDDWIEDQADPASIYASLDEAAKKTLQNQALSEASTKTATDATVAPGATTVTTRVEGSGTGLAGARGPVAEFTVLVPFEAETPQGRFAGQALWQVTMVHDGGAWTAESLTLRGVLP
ncbi:MAG: hypothetical protein LBD90_08340 [Bifidobacteriaceae bacterium]|nr:hypothetical protein [Bifidobacteriaceae bacterium]